MIVCLIVLLMVQMQQKVWKNLMQELIKTGEILCMKTAWITEILLHQQLLLHRCPRYQRPSAECARQWTTSQLRPPASRVLPRRTRLRRLPPRHARRLLHRPHLCGLPRAGDNLRRGRSGPVQVMALWPMRLQNLILLLLLHKIKCCVAVQEHRQVYISRRCTHGTIRYGHGLLTQSGEPSDLCDALSNANWKQAMDAEFLALMRNKTWHLVHPTHGRNKGKFLQCHQLKL